MNPAMQNQPSAEAATIRNLVQANSHLSRLYVEGRQVLDNHMQQSQSWIKYAESVKAENQQLRQVSQNLQCRLENLQCRLDESNNLQKMQKELQNRLEEYIQVLEARLEQHPDTVDRRVEPHHAHPAYTCNSPSDAVYENEPLEINQLVDSHVEQKHELGDYEMGPSPKRVKREA